MSKHRLKHFKLAAVMALVTIKTRTFLDNLKSLCHLRIRINTLIRKVSQTVTTILKHMRILAKMCAHRI